MSFGLASEAGWLPSGCRRHRALRGNVSEAGGLKVQHAILGDYHCNRAGDFTLRAHEVTAGWDVAVARFRSKGGFAREAVRGVDQRLGVRAWIEDIRRYFEIEAPKSARTQNAGNGIMAKPSFAVLRQAAPRS